MMWPWKYAINFSFVTSLLLFVNKCQVAKDMVALFFCCLIFLRILSSSGKKRLRLFKWVLVQRTHKRTDENEANMLGVIGRSDIICGKNSATSDERYSKVMQRRRCVCTHILPHDMLLTCQLYDVYGSDFSHAALMASRELQEFYMNFGWAPLCHQRVAHCYYSQWLTFHFSRLRAIFFFYYYRHLVIGSFLSLICGWSAACQDQLVRALSLRSGVQRVVLFLEGIYFGRLLFKTNLLRHHCAFHS